MKKIWKGIKPFLPILICLAFFAAYSTLAIVRHLNYQSFGYDLGINDQVVWHYSTFYVPLSTLDPFPGELKLYTHIELVFALISPFYWIWDKARTLLIVQAGFVCLGSLGIYFLAMKRGLNYWLSLALLVTFLTFYGVQNALWFDVHSAAFGAAFLAWFLYFLDRNHKWGSIIFFLLAITSKENFAILTLSISAVYWFWRRDRLTIFFGLASAAYLFFVFFIYFPLIIQTPYLYQNKGGFFSTLNPVNFINTEEKVVTILYSLFGFGFLPLLAPLTLLPLLADLATYFVVGSELTAAHGIFMHYRISLAPLLAWAAIIAISGDKKLNTKHMAFYLLGCAALLQYMLHLPLSYLTKEWFWTQPASVKNIEEIRINHLPAGDSVVAQNNIIPHIGHRHNVFELYPEKKDFAKNSPCGKPTCNWFRWFDSPKYLFVDLSTDWDIRHLLANREDFVDGIRNLENAGVIKKHVQVGESVLYIVEKNPGDL